MRTHHRWTAQEIEIVRREYEQTTLSSERIAHKLGNGITALAVRKKAAQIGVCKVTDRRKWTPEEDRQLANLYERGNSLGTIARKMHRSINSVKLHARRYLGITFRSRAWFTKKDVCEILGVDHRWVQRRIDAGSLRARAHFPGDIPAQKGQHPWHIIGTDLAAFITKHPHELTGRNVDLVAIVELLTGEGE